MSDPAADLQAAIRTALKADAPLIALFDQGVVPVYDIPPVNKAGPYLVIGDDDIQADQADCIDGAEIDSNVHIWTQTDPPGKLLAKQIGATVQACLLAMTTIGAVHKLCSVWPVRSSYLTDPSDNRTVHGVVSIHFVTEPL